jgi:20S proteasome alpha/beta subunit
VLRSGSAADTQAITDIVKYRLGVMRYTEDRLPTVYRAAQIFRQYLYDYRDQLSGSVLVVGWDAEKGGQVRERFPRTCVRSGLRDTYGRHVHATSGGAQWLGWYVCDRLFRQ